MRLTEHQVQAIRDATLEVVGHAAPVWLFGSRTNETSRGGDVDLMVQLNDPVNDPASLMIKLATKVSKSMYGRKVDVLIDAPNLKHFPIHDLVKEREVLL
jgi:predicted nucleotidyltransferase